MKPAKQIPRIMKSTLTKPPQWFVVTRYTLKSGINPLTGEDVSYLAAREKFDVSDQMRAILKSETRTGGKP